MAYFFALKLMLYWYVCWFLGSALADWSLNRTRPWITLKRFDPTNKRWFCDGHQVRMPKGKNTQFLIDDRTTDDGKLTNCKREAATARALGKDVYVFNFNRRKNFIQFESCNASVPGRNYNFLTNTFEGVVDETKDVYVQYFQTK